MEKEKTMTNVITTEGQILGFMHNGNFRAAIDNKNAVELVNAVILTHNKKLVEKTGPIFKGYKITVKNKKDGKEFNIVISEEDIFSNRGVKYYTDKKGNPYVLPNDDTVVKVMRGENGNIIEIDRECKAQKISYRGYDKDSKKEITLTKVIPNEELYTAKIVRYGDRVLYLDPRPLHRRG